MLSGSSLVRSKNADLPTAIPRMQPKTVDNKIVHWPLTLGLMFAVVVIGILCFWSMSPTPFNAPQMLNGTWTGTALGEVDEDERIVDFSFNLRNQITASLRDNYDVLPINDDGTPLMVGQRPVGGMLRFVPLQISGMLWSASAPCGDAICAFALRRGEALLTIMKGEDIVEYSLVKKGGSTFLGLKSDGSQHKIRYAIVIFIVVTFLKLALSKLQPSDKTKRPLSRRRM